MITYAKPETPYFWEPQKRTRRGHPTRPRHETRACVCLGPASFAGRANDEATTYKCGQHIMTGSQNRAVVARAGGANLENPAAATQSAGNGAPCLSRKSAAGAAESQGAQGFR